MRTRWLRPGTAGVVGLILLGAIGCSQQEPLEPDPGVSPFYPGPTAGSPAPGGTGPAGTAADLTGSAAPATTGPIRPQDVERQLRIALRTAEKGDSARAVALLDRVLEVEPVNREALLGRARIALEQSQRAKSPAERAAALEQAGSFIRAVRRAYEQSNKKELAVFAAVLFEEVKHNAGEKRLDRAVAVLKEAYEAGFDAFERVANDKDLAELRSSPGYHALLESIDAANLAKSRVRVKNHLDHPIDFAFDFNLKDLDGKPLSLGQFKGRVVLVDIWGTWCEPCQKAIPGLIQLYYRHRRRGLEIIGLDFEQNAPDAETARQYVKQVVQQMNIPYRIAMGEDSLLAKIPGFRGFPTTLLIDRAGRVRLLVTENAEGVLGALDDCIEVLMAESEKEAAALTPAKAGTTPAEKKSATKPK